MASCMGMVALSIDLMLPAFPDARADFGLPADSTQTSWIITAFFLGLAGRPARLRTAVGSLTGASRCSTPASRS